MNTASNVSIAPIAEPATGSVEALDRLATRSRTGGDWTPRHAISFIRDSRARRLGQRFRSCAAG